MRILVISNLYPPVVRGGYEVECSYAVESLRREHDVLVLTSDAGRRRSERQAGLRRELPLVPPGPRGSLQAPNLARRAVRVLDAALEDFAPELVYVWNGSQIPQAALRAVDRSGVPIAYRVCEHWFGDLYRTDQFMRHLHGTDRGLRAVWAMWPRTLNRLPPLRLEFESTARAAISWNSNFMRSRVPVPPTVEVVHEAVSYPVTPQCDYLAGSPRRPAADPMLAFVGRLTWEKGADVACHAVAALRARHGIDAKLVLAGDGEPAMRRELARLAHELQIEIELPGRLDRSAVAKLLAGAQALVMPAMWEEPAPMVGIEGALARVPVVAARVGGIPELLHEEEHALFFAMGDVEGCAEAIAATLLDPSSTEARVRRAFAHCRTFSFAEYQRQQRGFIAEAIDAFARATPRSVRTDSRERQGDPGGKRGDGPTEVGPSPGC